MPPLEGGDTAKFVAASNYAVDCLKIALRDVDSWKPSEKEAKSEEMFYKPCPRSSVSASLELLSITSKVRKAADAILNAHGHNLALSLSPVVHTPECDKMVATIIRHLVEDEAALQAYMETSIRQSMQKKRRTIVISDAAPTFKTMSLKQFFSTFMNLAYRDPVVFCKAVDNTCEFTKVLDKVNVRLASETQPVASPDPVSSQIEDQKEMDTDQSQPADAKKSQKLPQKKSGKRVPSPVSAVIDAIIGRLMQASSPFYIQKVASMMSERVTDSEDESQLNMRAELFSLSQQSLCVNMMLQLLISFSHCVTAF